MLSSRKARDALSKLNWNDGLLAPGLFGLGLFSSFFSQVVLGYTITAYEFGVYVLIYTGATVFSGVGAAGFDLSAIRFVSLARSRKDYGLLAAFLRMATRSIVFMSVLTGAVFVAYLALTEALPLLTMVLAFLVVVFWSCTRGMAGVLRGLGSLSFALSIDRVVRDLFVLIFAAAALAIAMHATIDTALSALFAGTLFGFVAGLSVIRRDIRILRRDPAFVLTTVDGIKRREWRNASLGLMGYNLVELLSSRFDVFILSFLVSTETVGAFGIALMLINLVTIPSGFIGILIMPRIAVAHDRRDLAGLRSLFLQTSVAATISGAAIALALFVLQPFIVKLLPQALAEMLNWNIVLAAIFARAFCLIGTFPAAMLTMVGRHKALIVSNMLSMVLRIVIFFIFFKYVSLKLAVISFAAGTLLATTINIFQVRGQLWPAGSVE